MNWYLTDSLAREHAERMMAGAAASRLAHEARLAGPRSAATTTRTRSALFAHVAARPVLTLRGWIAAGQL